jgi:hypothetical protein
MSKASLHTPPPNKSLERTFSTEGFSPGLLLQAPVFFRSRKTRGKTPLNSALGVIVKNMSWEAVATIAEIVGAIGVIVSVLYLAYEVRLNTKTMRADSSKDAARSWSEFNQWMTDHPSRLVFLRAFDPDESLENFDVSDRQALSLMFRSFTQLTESEFFQYRAGILEQEVWNARIRTFSSFFQFPVFKSWWETELNLPIYTESFLDCVKNSEGVALDQETVWGAGNRDATELSKGSTSA